MTIDFLKYLSDKYLPLQVNSLICHMRYSSVFDIPWIPNDNVYTVDVYVTLI